MADDDGLGGEDGGFARDGDDARKKVWLSRLSLTDFRNYESLSLDLDERPVVLTGCNGAGKTNLLEAVSLLSSGRGLKGAAFGDLSRAGGIDVGERARDWAVAARLFGPAGEVTIGTGLKQRSDEEGRASRIIKIDGQPAKSSGQLGDYVHVSWLTPAMDGLFTGPASDRRAFLDRLMAPFDKSYQKRVNHFERAMRQRNRLLEMGDASDALFSGLEVQMAEIGVAIAADRLDAVSRLSAVIDERREADPECPFPWGQLTIEGTLERDLRNLPAVDVEDLYIRSLKENRGRDRAAKRTLEGPHRSDLVVYHGPKNILARLCSTGEQKALLVGLILAHSELVKHMHYGYAPVLLLDEISAHLDEVRRGALMENILSLSIQAWMTGTDRSNFSAFGGNAQFLTVDQGRIIS